MSSTRSTLHRRLSHFVDWLAPDEDIEDDIRNQAEEVRGRIKSQAVKDDLTVRSTPNAGSFAARTGLRRHMTGGSEVEGLDVDLPFVVSPRTKEDEALHSLLDRFERYARNSYPDTARETTKSSVRLTFKNTRRSFDLVPMLATEERDRQIIIRASGERVETSVQNHVEFIRGRTRASNELDGRVKFNECVRLLKWWREFRQVDSEFEVPSFVVGLLCAHAYDECGVEESYADTLARWFAHLAHVVRKRHRVAFSDFATPPPQGPSDSGGWDVLDPINPDNNIVAGWHGYEIDELAEWLARARDTWPRVIRSDEDGKDAESLNYLVELFGTPFKHHCEEG